MKALRSLSGITGTSPVMTVAGARSRHSSLDLQHVTQTFDRFRTGPLRFLLFPKLISDCCSPVQPRWESECAIRLRLGAGCRRVRRGAGPIRRRGEEPRRRGEGLTDRRLRADGPSGPSNAARSSVFGQVEPGSAPAGNRQAVNPARAERRRRLRLWSGSSPAFGLDRRRVPTVRRTDLPGCDKHTGSRGRGLSPCVPHALFRDAKKTG